MGAPPFIFREQRNTVYYHDMRIYISGADVTPWITSGVTLSKADRNGINTLTFSLSNQYKAFEITSRNLGETSDATVDEDNNFSRREADRIRTAGAFNLTNPYDPGGRYSELAKAVIFKIKRKAEINTKLEVSSFGAIRGTRTGGKITDQNLDNNANSAQSDVTSRYPMHLGSLVLHKYDPIRFFVKNPLSRDDNEWVCEFTGYIDTKPFSQNYINGESVINVSCQDIRMLMSIMRAQVNPAAQVGNENTLFFGGSPGAIVQDSADAGFFNDLLTPGQSNVSHVLGGKTFQDSIKYLLFGVPRSGARVGRVGKLTEGLTFNYNPAANNNKGDKELLERWNNLINFGSTPLPTAGDNAPSPVQDENSDLFETAPQGEAAASNTLDVRETYLTKAEMLSLGRSTVVNEEGSPDNGRVHFLFPADDAPLSNLVSFNTVDTQYANRIEFSSRLDLLNQMCKSIDYQMYVTGIGDIVFEFPFYDFLPTDFNEQYNNLYTFKDHLINDNINDEGGTPITALQVNSRSLRGEINQGNPADPNTDTGVANSVALTRTIFSNVLASRIGVHVETHDLPGITDQNRLTQYGYIEFNKRLADYNRFDMITSYRPYIHVNRPVYNVHKSKMGITNGVTYSWRIRQEVTLEMSLSYARSMEGNKFRFITGGERQPISYKTVFDGIKVPTQGVNNDNETTDDGVNQNEETATEQSANEANESNTTGG